MGMSSMKAGSSGYLEMHPDRRIFVSKSPYIVGITFAAGIGGLLFGYDTGILFIYILLPLPLINSFLILYIHIVNYI